MQPSVDRSQLALELGIFAKTFRRTSIDEVFDAIAFYGLTCTQWNWACVPGLSSLPEAVPRETSRAVARAALRNSIQISAVSATFNIIQPGVREEGLARLPALAAAVSMGCHLLTLCTGTRHPTDMWTYHPDNGSREAWADTIDGLRKATRIASQYGVRLAIEPETANVIADARGAQAAFRRTWSRCQFTFNHPRCRKSLRATS
jgi:sugar phosphate isomerase/epimerase